jgi:hypothetical protein
VWIAIAIGLAALVACAPIAAMVHRRRVVRAVAVEHASAHDTGHEDAPNAALTGLDEALERVTDGSGATIAERLDAETDALDELRVSDDTGPLLRRALDAVDAVDTPDSPSGTTADGAGSDA